jgi:hypothetical protein
MILFSLKKLLHSLDRGIGIWYSPRTPEASPGLWKRMRHAVVAELVDAQR